MRPFLTLHSPKISRHYYERGYWREETLYGLLAHHASARPDAHALRDGRERLTWSQVLARVDGIAAALASAGLEAGDRVSLWTDNRLEGVVVALACFRSAIACNPSLHRTYTSSEIVALLDRLKSRVLYTVEGWGADGRPNEISTRLKASTSLKAVWSPGHIPSAGGAPPAPVSDPDKVIYLAFTSGTTGVPKCVMHSDNTLLANCRDLVSAWKVGSDSRILSLSPLSHHIFWVGIGQWLVSGGEFITDDAPPGLSRLDWIRETRATYVMGVPTHAMDVLAEQTKRGMNGLGSVRTFYMAGAPIPPVTAAAFIEQGIVPQNIYGMTETSSHQFTHPDDTTATIVGSCGRGGSSHEVRIFDVANQDVEVPRGVEGQIGSTGAALMLGYFDNQSATEASFNRDGWFMSGDLGIMDEAGNLKISGRLKDLIIRGGHNIHPAHIEAYALRHAGVARCAAYPVADERLGERVCVAIIGDVEPEALLEHLAAEGLSKFDMPEFFVRLQQFPLTPSGKIMKRELIEMTRRGEIVPRPVRFVPAGGANQ